MNSNIHVRFINQFSVISVDGYIFTIPFLQQLIYCYLTPLKTENRRETNFVVTSGTVICRMEYKFSYLG